MSKLILNMRPVHSNPLAGARLAAVAAGVAVALLYGCATQGTVASGDEDCKLPPDWFVEVETPPGSIKEPEGQLSKVLWWLKTHQEQDGSWNDGPCPAASTALALCAYMSYGIVPGMPGMENYTDSFIAGWRYLVGCVEISTNGTVHVRGQEQDPRVQPMATMAFCWVWGMTHNPDLHDYGIHCLEQLVRDVRVRVADESWNGNDEYFQWADLALRAGWLPDLRWNGRGDGLEECGRKIAELMSGRKYTGYYGEYRRYLAAMPYRRRAAKKDEDAFRVWNRKKIMLFVERFKEENGIVMDKKGVWHRQGYIDGGIYEKLSGLGVSADNAIAIMAWMIAGAGGRHFGAPVCPWDNFPPEEPVDENPSAGVVVEI